MMDIDVFVLCCITDLHNAGFKYLMYLCICAVGEKNYLIPCWFCTFAHWQRNDQSIILMVGLFEQWETE